MVGSFGIATPEQALFTKVSNPSVTSDGTYLYVCAHRNKIEMMYKIGTGENQTIAGKVYLINEIAESNSFNSWVFCGGKLYAKRTDDDFGALYVIDTCSLRPIETIKLNFQQHMKNLSKQEKQIFTTANQHMPLLTDGNQKSLFVVTLTTEKRRKSVPEEKKEEYDDLVKRIDGIIVE